MLLKRLEMNGFKSFADKVAIDFVPGMTAVVGPNGSGKSNITEAIRWVLGEQSAKSLRGGRMGDVIFAGSDTRKPINFAEVSLVLANDDHYLPLDYSEVVVTRRIYRNGDSEFLINKQTCRLKDIVDLFMDSGLGRESMSIISQGKIDEILNSKPEERRSIFEEAAGVLKYKNRKKQAENKLVETEENLNRVEDILHELDGQLEPLEIQASIAKDYLYQQEELEKYEVGLIAFELEAIARKLEGSRTKFMENQAALVELRKEIANLEGDAFSGKEKITETDETLEKMRNDLLHETERLEQLEGERNLVLERKKHGSENASIQQDTLAQALEKIASLETEKEKLLTGKREKEAAYEVSVREQKELLEKLKHYDALSEEAIENQKSDLFELKYQETTIRNDIGYVEREIAQQEAKTARLDHENREHLKTREEQAKRTEKMREELDEIHLEIEEQLGIYQDVKQVVEQKTNEFERAERELYRHYEKVQQTKSRKETLGELAEDYAGFFQGVREVLKAKETLGGIHGALVELIQIPADYRKAMEIALSASAQHVVVESDQAAREAIQYLKKTHAGRATFLPLSTIQPRHIPEATRGALRNEPAFINLASEVVTYDEKFAPVILNTLGTTILAKDLRGASRLAKLVNYRFRVVTLDGDVVNAGGSMTGGATKQGKSSIISRKNELDELAKVLAALERETAQYEETVKKAKEVLANKRSELEETRQIGENLRMREHEVKSKHERELEAFERINKQLSLYDAEKKSGEEEMTALKKRKEELLSNQLKLGEEIESLDQKIQQTTEESKAASSRKKADEKVLSALQVKMAAQKEQLQTATNDVERIEAALFEQYQEKEAAESKIQALQDNLTNVSTSVEETSREIEKLRAQKEETALKIQTLSEERSELQKEVKQLEEKLTEENNKASFYLEQKNQAEIEIGRAEVDAKNRADRLLETYGVSLEEAQEREVPDMPEEELRGKVRLLKRSIEELGTVNLGAIEEFDRISERFDFLKGQQEDLLNAKETLFQVMGEMDEEVKKRFGESFEAIKHEFSAVFPELFGGGKAELVLLNPEDLLTTGIDIVAQPPGKKLQNLSLRSGGERALTAIALLFAIIRVRPVPFCILDEVEAALDEANVVRFSRYLKQFEQSTQFIVITHRKGTMEEADVLYGVTMQESGVSKLVSVRLEETAELIK
ncbi:chromosome segregation protein SMC [Listeria kieliensis]|uniref:Chromosome partition protein Smc n=1 Tax=Listeria kieliensis TaxID=1621700 RepID=A0A3D8TNT4_9LIST|nr:chromosome segregation protein SMC [Listeria kieliensis]RDX00528.1 chromosome segregation protein [Listeria kieliensis]